MIYHEANLSENEASVAWGQERGQILRGRGRGQKMALRPCWPRGLNIPVKYAAAFLEILEVKTNWKRKEEFIWVS